MAVVADEVLALVRNVLGQFGQEVERPGRMQGVVSWAVVDMALQTGQRVSEMVRHVVGDFDQ